MIISIFNKNDKVIVSIILVAWAVIAAIILGTVFDFFDTTFFSFGPRPGLYTIGTNYNINTWSRYITVSLFLVFQGFIITFAGDYMYPWINSVVLNPDIETIRMPKIQAWLLTNNMYLTFTFLGLFSLGAGMAQIDLFIYSNLASLIAGGLQSAIKIKQKKYIITDQPLEDVV